ncbi:NAD-dependent epimerase/dehydratase family protein [Pontibacter sp. MBLB2868]|uniref:NAD-dependent epimerase/dehydratase family protein n=1 Tax=Pontibacter sp. MBLB2868 TaxID=3451555 RepID=UPI003F7558CA
MAEKLRILVTGSAGFIGHHLMMAIARTGNVATGLDNINDYYDPELKFSRLKVQGFEKNDLQPGVLVKSKTLHNLSFIKLSLTDTAELQRLFQEEKFDIVVNLAAQAGVRHSIEQPQVYINSNLVGFANLLECCRNGQVKHFLFASSSSVYGLNENIPFKTDHKTDFPISLYAATKKANEVMAHSYAHLYGIPTTGLRFFTVYGPWGRPDMACYSFTEAISTGKTIKLFNHGNMLRDFTFIDDVTESIMKLLTIAPVAGATAGTSAAYKIFNIGNNTPEQLLDLVANLENLLQTKAKLELYPMQAGDVLETFADVDDLITTANFSPRTPLSVGLAKFVDWYKAYTGVKNVSVIKEQQ